jgi:hypothetical protein
MKRITSLLSAIALVATGLLALPLATAVPAHATVDGCRTVLREADYLWRAARLKACYEGAKGVWHVSACVQMMEADGVDPATAQRACEAAAV